MLLGFVVATTVPFGSPVVSVVTEGKVNEGSKGAVVFTPITENSIIPMQASVLLGFSVTIRE